MPKRTDINSVLIIGAGPIVIGQACEFDYSGAQACKALREEGYRVILVNSNPATIMTDPDMADAIYIEPVMMAAGAKTEKMKFGHHGANHPVQDLESGKVMITSQNHGFSVDESSLPKNVVATHRSLFDGTLQGIALKDGPAFGFQGHPEASPGPHDLLPLFEQFIQQMASHKKSGLRTMLST